MNSDNRTNWIALLGMAAGVVALIALIVWLDPLDWSPNDDDNAPVAALEGDLDNNDGNGTNQATTGNSFNPYPFYSQSCDPQQNADGGCSWDIGTMGSLDFMGSATTQVGVVKGVSIIWDGNTADPSPNERCSLVLLTPNGWFENLTVTDANVTVYNVWPGDVAGWSKTLAIQAAQEQTADYGCPSKPYDSIEKWGSDIPSPPCGVEGFSNCRTTQSSTQQQSASCETLDCGNRTATANTGGSTSFNAGDAVYGFSIDVGGIHYQNCYFSGAPGSGIVTDGVVHPWTDEIAGKQTC